MRKLVMSETEDAVLQKSLSSHDTVEYRLYPVKGEECSHESLTELAVGCTHLARSLTTDHIWHYEHFRLAAWAEEKGSHPPHLFGITCFHDNVEDEWLIVYLLFALSKRHSQLVISVCDSDGEFLLIESAHQLPKWLKPETSQNRVFIHRGKLHIIPKPRTPAEVTFLPVATPTIKEAIQLVQGEAPTEANDVIQEAIQRRIGCFPACIKSSLHHAHCYLPCPAAHVISHDPQLVAAAVHALCERDPADMKVCRRMEYFSPSKHTSITAEITFTRYLYAQLLHQHFSPPRNGGFRLPPVGSHQHKPCDLGMKLACGLEILVSRAGGVAGGRGEGGRREDVTSDHRWDKFVHNLNENGYFQDELEGSKLHQQLLQTAKEYFNTSVVDADHTGRSARDPLQAAGKRITDILQTVPFTEEDVKKKWENLKPPDDDSWLEISPGQLDSMMRQAAGYLPQDTPPSADPTDLESMVTGMKSFVDKISTHKGAEFPWSADDTSEVRFDPDSFMQTVQDMLEGRRDRGRHDSESCDDSGLSISDSEEDSGGVSSGEEPTDRDMAAIMQQMDRELAQTEVGKSFERVKLSDTEKTAEAVGEGGGGSGGELEDLRPVDIDFNLVHNLLESYSSQMGGAGPASNILHSMGVAIPREEEEEEGGAKGGAR